MPATAALRVLRDGAALSLTTFTVVPVRRLPAIDRRAARVAMALAPLIGALLGAVIGGLALGLRETQAPAILIGALCVGAAALLTRGLHLDGLADTVDALGSYRDRDRALAIMKSPEVGPFGVVAIVLTLLIQAAAISALASRPGWRLVLALAAASATGRAAASWACRRGVPAARPDGLGALVAGTMGPLELGAGTVFAVALGVAADPSRPWRGVIAVLAGLAASVVLVWHCKRRFGGVTGDVLGAAVEVAVTASLVFLEVL